MKFQFPRGTDPARMMRLLLPAALAGALALVGSPSKAANWEHCASPSVVGPNIEPANAADSAAFAAA